MNEETEVLDPQPEVQEEEAQPTSEEIADWKRKAEVSSQNFERAKKAEEEKKALAAKVAELEALQNTDLEFLDPNDPVQKRLKEVDAKLAQLEEREQLADVHSKYPALKDKREEFDAYRQDYPLTKLEVVAKLFLTENGLLDEPTKRKGLEKAGGGQRTTPQAGKFTAEDAKRLRETNFKEYMKLVRAGKLQIAK